MRRTTVIQISDGTQRPDERSARAYCDEQMGGIITMHAHRIAHIDKFLAILAYLEENLPSLAEAARWQAESREKLTEDKS